MAKTNQTSGSGKGGVGVPHAKAVPPTPTKGEESKGKSTAPAVPTAPTAPATPPVATEGESKGKGGKGKGGKGKGGGKGKPTPQGRPILYPRIEVDICVGKECLTADKAKALLGWKELSEESGAKVPHLTTDYNEAMIRCENNDTNRPFDDVWAKSLAWDILNRNWADSRNSPPGTKGMGTEECDGLTLNGETIVIGRTGRVLSGQHRLFGLVYAAQMWDGKNADHWREKWKVEPTIECLIVYGVDESARTTRTLDNVKKRTLSDVLFSNPLLYGNVPPADRKAMARMTDACIRMLWHRTHAKEQPFAPMQTHSESLDFLERHPHIVDSVMAVWQMDKRTKDDKGKLGPAPLSSTFGLSPGYVAAFLYLMGSSDSDIDAYINPDNAPRREGDGKGNEFVTWNHWEHACRFWESLATGGEATTALAEELIRLENETKPAVDADGMELPTTMADAYENRFTERQLATIIVAWHKFLAGDPMEKPEDCQPEYTWDETKERYTLAYHPTTGGIDFGPPVKESKKAKEAKDNAESEANPPSEEQVEEETEEILDNLTDKERQERAVGHSGVVPNRPFLEQGEEEEETSEEDMEPSDEELESEEEDEEESEEEEEEELDPIAEAAKPVPPPAKSVRPNTRVPTR